VKSIGNMAFYGCSSLTDVTIPDSVTSIGNSAFFCCNNLSTVNMENHTMEYIRNMGNFSWGLGAYLDTEEKEHYFEMTIHCSDGDVIINPPETIN